MALSGAYNLAVGSHWRLRVEWSATQNISNNTSTVTSQFFWEGLTQYSAVYASASNSGSSTIDGTTGNFTATSGLNAYQKKLLHTHSKTITHDSDGTKKFSMSHSYNINATLAGTYYGNRTINSGTITLDTIPRASTISSSANFTAGNNLSISVSRASSSFTHIARVKVNGTTVYTTSSSSKFGTSVTASLDHASVFQQLVGQTSRSVVVELDTYSGSTKIGSTQTKSGTCTAPNASTVNSSSATFNIGSSVGFSVSRANSGFTHTIRVKLGSTTIKTITGVGTSTTWNPTTTEINNMYATTPNSNSIGTTIEVETFYSGYKVRSTTTRTGTATVTDANPTFSSSQFTYADTNSSVVTITGSNQHIVQGKSSLSVTLSSLASANKGASMSKYVITVDGKSFERTTTGTTSVGAIDASSNITLSIQAIDSRGNSTTATKTVTVFAYTPPTLGLTLKRLNNFENNTTLTVNGSFSSVNGKNTIQNLTYRYKRRDLTTWGSSSSLARTTTGTNYSASYNNFDFDNTYGWDVEVTVTDRLGTRTQTVSVGTGQPIFFLDAERKAVGVGRLPIDGFKLDVQGNIRATSGVDVSGHATFRNTMSVAGNVSMFGNLSIGANLNITEESDAYRVQVSGTGYTSRNHIIFGREDGNQAFTFTNRVTSNSGFFLPNASGTANGYLLPDQNSLSYADGITTVYANRANGNSFRVRSHSNSSSYQNDMIIDSNGHATFRGGVTSDGTLNVNAGINATARVLTPEVTAGSGNQLTLTGSTVRMQPNGSSIATFDYGNGSRRMQLGWHGYLKIVDSTSQFEFRNSADTGWATVRGTFSNQSTRDSKKNIELVEESYLDKILTTPVYRYHYNEDNDLEFKRLGLILEECPPEIIAPIGNSIELYAMNSFMWKAMQEQQKIIVDLKERVTKLEGVE